MQSIKSVITIMLFITMVACAPKSSDEGGNPPGYSQTVSTIVDSSDCLATNNADVTVDYLMGDKQSKHLYWKCLETNESELHFFAFDYADQCYKEAQKVTYSNCIYPILPATPLYSVNISEFSGYMQPIGGGSVSFSHRAIAENIGNVIAFGVKWEIVREPGQILKSGVFDPIEYGGYYNWKNVPFIAIKFDDIAIGEDVQFTFTIRSHYGDLLDSQTITLSP